MVQSSSQCNSTDPNSVALQGLLASAPGASYDSKDAEHEELCLPGTRVEVLREIHDWASSDQRKCIFWLCGMAGTGKSTISRSVAHSLSETRVLGASFFFKRGEADRGNAKKLFPTIAKQIACKIPGLLPLVSEAAIETPDLAEKGLNVQFDEIIIKPLQRLTASGSQPQTVIVIVIDALDECDGDNDIRLIIKLLPRLQEISAVRLRVLVTSRPDLPLRLGFRKLADEDHKDLILHEIPRSIISSDISLYLNHQSNKSEMNGILHYQQTGLDRRLSSSLWIFLSRSSFSLLLFVASSERITGTRTKAFPQFCLRKNKGGRS